MPIPRPYGQPWVCLDDRTDIGPHHLAIGKTRKLFEFADDIHAFYSQGYAIGHARLNAHTLEIKSNETLTVPVAFGGGAFCVDGDGSGQVSLVFVHRNRHELCFLSGTASEKGIGWKSWRSILTSGSPLAAPWLETAPDGTVWCSTLLRDGSFRIAILNAEGEGRVFALFAAGEASWHHSCVQVLPVQSDLAVAVGFRGAFPTKTGLVFKTISRDGCAGLSQTLAPCNVNDQLTFHFQAVGDPARERAHIVYLDEGLSVSHAMYEHGEWALTPKIIPFASYAPQVCVNESGGLALIAVDYDGAVWSSAWERGAGWTAPQPLRDLPKLTISGSFGRTGYGTGGLISAARSQSGRVPFLMGVIEDDKTAHARLYAASVGYRSGLIFAPGNSVSITAKGKQLIGKIFLTALAKADLDRTGRAWIVSIPVAGDAAPLKLAITAERGRLAANLYRQSANGVRTSGGLTNVLTHFHDAFSCDTVCGAIEFSAELATTIEDLRPEAAWVESYDAGWSASGCTADCTLVDISPFQPEVNARAAHEPDRIPSIFKRII